MRGVAPQWQVGDVWQCQVRSVCLVYYAVLYTVSRVLTSLDVSMSRCSLSMFSLDVLSLSLQTGGRITDDKDMRTAEVIMNGFYKPEVLDLNYKFSLSGLFINPEYDEEDPYQSYVDTIAALPLNAEPEVFGTLLLLLLFERVHD